jgi:hypothetical protein
VGQGLIEGAFVGAQAAAERTRLTGRACTEALNEAEEDE